MHKRTMGKHWLTRFTTAWIWEKLPPSPLIVFPVLGHGACTQMSFCLRTSKLGVPRFPKLGLLQLWKPIIFCSYLRLRWGLHKSCSLHWEISNDMWHATWTKINQDDSDFLWLGIKLAVWLLSFLLAITCVLNTQMGHANPF